jgi:hypothetical protein
MASDAADALAKTYARNKKGFRFVPSQMVYNRLVACTYRASVHLDPPLSAQLSFPKISSEQICAVRQNQRIIRRDACDPPSAGNVRRRHVQATTQARSRELVSPPSAHHRLAAGAASSPAAWL